MSAANTAPWMSADEARTWILAAVEAVPPAWKHRREKVSDVLYMLDASEPERMRAAADLEWEAAGMFIFPARVTRFCACVLRAVKA